MSDVQHQRPHCWECRRRRLVCDGTQPVCRKCRTAGIVCPGFADKQPLKWLAPGQVVSRARRKQEPRKAKGKGPTKVTPASTDSIEDSASDQHTDNLDVVLPVELRPESRDAFEALTYYNSHIYQDLVQHQFGPSAYVLPLVLVDGPPYIVHTLITFALSHRIMQVAEDPASNQLVKPMWTRLHRHLSIALPAINKLVSNEATRKGLATIIAVYTLLFATLQQSLTPGWRTQADALMALIRPRGTVPDVIRNIPVLKLHLMALCIISILANTTSPRNNQLHVATASETLLLIQTHFTETYFPSFPCPPELFTELLHINDLRTYPPSPETTHTAHLILSRLESFSPETWSSALPRQNLQPDWHLLSSVCHASITLYAILSLQSSGALAPPSSSPELELSRARHARKLFALLEQAMATPRVRRRMTWPLVVAGVEAARAGREVQRYIAVGLKEMSRDHGSAAPLVAKGMLERFWAEGGGGWDECFREPLAFVM